MAAARPVSPPAHHPSCRRTAGFSIVELMVAMTISLFLLLGLVGLFVNTSKSGRELSKTNLMIDAGRAAIQILQTDIEHAGYWGGYVPQFDDLTSTVVPGDVPADPLPSPCQSYTSWDSNSVRDVIGLPILAYETLPTGTGCVPLPTTYPQHANTDVLVIRHLEVCVPGATNCDADVAGSLYFQTSFCALEQSAGTTQAATSTTITLDGNASSTTGAYVGLMLHTVSGTGSGQFRQISAYDGSTHVATISTAWSLPIPDATTAYAFAYTLGTSSFPLYKRDCVGTGTPATLPITGGTINDKRKFLSDIYYIADYPNPDYPTQLVPTLMRSRFDLSGGSLAHQLPVPLIDGVEGFKVVLGIDNVSKSGAAADYTQAVNWQDPTNLVLPTNRGDGFPDQYVRCLGAGGCTASQLINVVAVKLYILVRDRDTSPGYADTKTYCLGEPNSDGTCPIASRYTPNDNYKRHMFITTIRVNNVSQRRETPP